MFNVSISLNNRQGATCTENPATRICYTHRRDMFVVDEFAHYLLGAHVSPFGCPKIQARVINV